MPDANPHPTRRPLLARRSWLFVDGADESAWAAAAASGADVIIQDLEDSTAPARRPFAREHSPACLRRWRESQAVAGVRINSLETEGMIDLEAIMRGAPDLVFLPKTCSPKQVARLAAELDRLERAHGLPAGATEIVPNVELALGLHHTFAICQAHARVTACLVASEDMANDLGAERSREGGELDYVRARFHAECVAAGVLSIDCPYTWTDAEGVEADTRKARRWGYRAKSAVLASHAAIINRVLTPTAADIAQARRIVAAFEQAQGKGDGHAEVDGSLVEVPIYLNARRLLERAQGFGLT